MFIISSPHLTNLAHEKIETNDVMLPQLYVEVGVRQSRTEKLKLGKIFKAVRILFHNEINSLKRNS